MEHIKHRTPKSISYRGAKQNRSSIFIEKHKILQYISNLLIMIKSKKAKSCHFLIEMNFII